MHGLGPNSAVVQIYRGSKESDILREIRWQISTILRKIAEKPIKRSTNPCSRPIEVCQQQVAAARPDPQPVENFHA